MPSHLFNSILSFFQSTSTGCMVNSARCWGEKMTPHGLCPHRVLTQLPKLNKLCPFDLLFFSCGVIPKLRASRYSEQCFHMTSGNWTLTVTKSQDWRDQRDNTMFSNEETETKASRKCRQSENKSRRALAQTQPGPALLPSTLGSLCPPARCHRRFSSK